MQAETFSAGASPSVIITGCQGGLVIEMWDERSFAVEPAEMSQAVVREGDALVIHAARGDMRLRVPAATAIAVDHHQGDLRIETIDGSVRLRDIDGSAYIRGAATLTVEPHELLRERKRIFGRPRRDLEAREIGTAAIAQVDGSLTLVAARRAAVGPIGGSATIRAVAEDVRVGVVGGSCEIDQVGGTLELGNVGGSCRIESVAGSVSVGAIGGSAELRATGAIADLGSIGGSLTLTEARLAEGFLHERAGQIAVGGSARIELPEAANLTIDAIVGGGVRGRGTVGGPGMRRIVYGDGSARVRMSVGGSLTLV
jgi:hypothetical protein